jgi:hypothetical protein
MWVRELQYCCRRGPRNFLGIEHAGTTNRAMTAALEALGLWAAIESEGAGRIELAEDNAMLMRRQGYEGDSEVDVRGRGGDGEGGRQWVAAARGGGGGHARMPVLRVGNRVGSIIQYSRFV